MRWLPVKCHKRNIAAYCTDLLQNFLIGYDKYYKLMQSDPNCPYEFAATDESYIHKNHASTHSRFKDDGTTQDLNRRSSKGDRAIIIHAITRDGPLCQRINNIPIDNIDWGNNTNTPHTIHNRGHGLHTCETIWKATLSKEDYHDNMNSKNFLLWIEEGLIPTFEALHGEDKKWF
jgi:hypothetical protein